MTENQTEAAAAPSGDGKEPPDSNSGKLASPEAPRKKKKGLLARARAKPDQWANLGVATEFTIIPIRKPRPDEFFRVMAGEDYTDRVNIIELKKESEWYLIDEDILPEIQLESTLKLMQLYVCVTQDGSPFVHCIPLPGPDGKINDWHESGHITMEEAKHDWIRRQASKSNPGYLVTKAKNVKLPDPKWPDLTLDEIIDKAFDKFYIDDVNHPVLQRLAGMKLS